MSDWEPYEVERYRVADIKPWFVCAFFGAAIGMTAAYNLGEVIDAADRFVRGADSTQAARMTLSAEILGEARARREAEAAPARAARVDVFPSAALSARDEAELASIDGLGPGQRLALRGRLELSVPAR